MLPFCTSVKQHMSCIPKGAILSNKKKSKMIAFEQKKFATGSYKWHFFSDFDPRLAHHEILIKPPGFFEVTVKCKQYMNMNEVHAIG